MAHHGGCQNPDCLAKCVSFHMPFISQFFSNMADRQHLWDLDLNAKMQ